jgi:AmmeMemoRadiSam system protein B
LTERLIAPQNVYMSETSAEAVDRPRLRDGLAAMPDRDTPGYVIVWDQLRISPEPLRLTRGVAEVLPLLNGDRTLRDVQAEVMRGAGGLLLPLETFAELVERLDAALFLDSPRFDAYLAGPVREPACLGCYPSDPEKLRRELRSYFVRENGPGIPVGPKPDGKLCAALLPHIDYARGYAAYAHGFKELFERSDASLFVIVATSHYSTNRFTITRKNFKTPLGVAPTDQHYIDRLERHYGDGLYDDPYAHFPEHSVELEVVWLQLLYENVRPIRIVPLLVGPFRDCVELEINPRDRADIRRMIAALRQAEAETSEPICYVISGDLAHIGRKFGDARELAESKLEQSREQDQKLLRKAEAVDSDGYFRVVAREQDCRRICGLPPTYMVLEAAQPASGRLLHYEQYVHPLGHESVSYASLVFEGAAGSKIGR